MSFSTHKRIAAAIAGAVLLALSAAVANGAVTVYSNDFSSKSEFREIKKSGGGKRCDRSYRKKQKAMRAAVKRNPTTCSFRPPVAGDGEVPNHDVLVDAKILKQTPKELQGGAFVEVAVRAGGGPVGYVLRVFPKRERYELEREPSGSGFPARGKNRAIKPVNKRNKLRLAATGAEVRAFVNGREVAKMTDQNPGQVSGRKIRFAVGSRKDKRGSVAATFKRVGVAVPNP